MIAAILLGCVVAATALGTLGVLVMHDSFQKLHYITLPAAIGAPLLAVVFFLAEAQKQAGVKVSLIALILFFMNAVVTHATARAAWTRETRMWPPPDDLPRGGAAE